eukprot:644173-Pelagomonas_calceolata.AAC.2
MWGGRRGGGDFWGPPLQNFSRPVLHDCKHIIGFLSSSPVDWHPFAANWAKGRGCLHGWESVPCAEGCGQQGLCKCKGAANQSKLTG